MPVFDWANEQTGLFATHRVSISGPNLLRVYFNSFGADNNDRAYTPSYT